MTVNTLSKSKQKFKNLTLNVGFEVLTVVFIKSIIYCIIMLCGLRKPEVSAEYVTSTFSSWSMPSNKQQEVGACWFLAWYSLALKMAEVCASETTDFF
jgi:hypothetical protein